MDSYRLKIWTVAAVAVLCWSAPAVADAARLTLKPHHPKIETRGPDYSLTTNANGDYVMTYSEAGRSLQVLFEPPNKVHLTVEAVVTGDGRGGFNYAYALANADTSPQPVTAFVVEYQGAVFDVKSPPAWESLPVEFMPAIYWFTSDPGLSGLRAGRRLSGMAMSASATASVGKFKAGEKEGFAHYSGTLPGVVVCHATGHEDVVAFDEEPPGALGKALPRFPYKGVGGRTVGPVALPEDGLEPWLLEQLKSYVRESSKQGWIESEVLAQKYSQFLGQIGHRMESKARFEANADLTIFGRQVEADFQQGKLTSEAYALLKHNSQFLENLLAEAR